MTVVGNGGIGSFVMPFLSILEPSAIFNYEFDTVENHNIGTQWFSVLQIGRTKSSASVENCAQFSNYFGVNNQGKFTEQSFTTAIVLCCVDSMEVRKMVFNKWREEHDASFSEAVFIDGRMGGTQIEVYVTENNPRQIEFYENTLVSDSSIPDVGCTTKSTRHLGAAVAVRMITELTNVLTNWYYRRDQFPEPCKTRNFYQEDFTSGVIQSKTVRKQ